MLEIFDKLNFTRAPKLFVLILLIFLGCLVSVSGQKMSDQEVFELLMVHALQIDNLTNNFVAVNEKSDWNSVYGNYVLLTQTGNINHALIEQVRGVGNIAKVFQQGNGNRVGYVHEGRKQRGFLQSGNSNYAEIEQFGNQNKSVMFQYGNHNEINIAQHGGTGFFIDYGARNKSVVRQTGDGNSATVTQTGDRNSATVIQTF